ncbi:MAG: hypothetical protein EOL87_17570, partial [Spartobacteria bacterium]|nr:hypothetical protein [Spartobacteria bacterium]
MKTNQLRLRSIAGAVIFVMGTWCACAQNVGTSITVDGAQPNANAMLDIQSPMSGDGKGLLIPRVTLSQRTSANAALAGGLLDNSGHLRGGVAQGLLVYQLDDTTGFYFNTSTSAVPAWAYIGDSTGDVKADGSVSMSGNLNMGGQAVTNGLFFGDGSGLTNVPASGITEVDPLWGAASNAVVTDISSRLLSNTWMSADSTTNYASRVAWTATNTGFQTQMDAKLDSNTWMSADSTTNYASRVAWNATNTGFQTQMDAKLDSNTWMSADSTTNYTLRTTYNTE